MKNNHSILRSVLSITLVILILMGLPASNAVAATEGPNNPAVGSNDNSIGTQAWVDPGNISTPGAPYAFVTQNKSGRYSNYLKATQYGFAIPNEATINGIMVVVNRFSDFHNPSILDNVVRLVKGGAIVGDNKASIKAWPLTIETATYGGATDLWGTTWTPNEVNADDFGVVLATYRQNNGNNDRTAYVDYIQVTVYFTNSTTTHIACDTPVTYGDSATCIATVSDVIGTNTPTGTVSWTTDSSGAFSPETCNLVGSGGVATCSTVYTPSAVGDGTHLITGTYSGDSYFTPSNGSQIVTVYPRPVTVTADTQTKTYGDLDPTLTYQVTSGSLVYGDEFSGALTRDPGEDVGNYAILQGTLALSDNYILTYEGADLTISLRAVEVTADAQSKEYGDSDPDLTYQVTSGSLVPGDEFTGSLERNPGEDVGTYAILQGTLALSDNYIMTYMGADLTISPRAVEATADAQTKVYGDSDPDLTYQISSGSLLPGDKFTGSLVRDPGEDVGTYAILQGTLALPGNYNLSFVGADLIITRRAIEVSADAKAKILGDPDPELTYQITVGSLAFEDAFTGALTREPGEVVGQYAILQGTLSLSDNYDLTYVGNFLNIGLYGITVTADPQTKVYGEEDPLLTYQITSGELQPGDEFSGELSRVQGEDVGTYAITQGSLSLPEYYALFFVGADLSITPREVEVTADAQTKVYGNPDPELTYQVTSGSLLPGDEFSGALTRDTGEDVGAYAILQGSLALSDNYVLSYVEAQLTITPRAVEVTADAQTKMYGDPDPEFTYQVTAGSLVPGDEFSGALTRDPGEDLGAYAILQGTLALSDNYSLSYMGAELSITLRAVEVTADAQTKQYGDADPELTYQVTSGSLVPGDEFSGALTREPGEDVGAYAILQGTLALPNNYNLTFVSADLTISLRQVTVTADAKSKDYGDPDPELTYQMTSGSLLPGDEFSGALTRDPGEALGTYAILQGTLTLPEYYDLSYEGAELSINPRAIEITADAQTKQYGDGDPELTFQVTAGSLLPGDEFSGALTRDPGEDVGTFAILQGTLALSDNYDLIFVSADLTITPRFVTVVADAKSKDYGQPDPDLTFQVTVGSLLPGDSFSGAITRQAGERIGTYAILQGTLSLPAYYELTFESATFTINGYTWFFPMTLRAP